MNSFDILNSKISLKWLADKIGTDIKEVRLNFNYFRQNVRNIPFALIHLDAESFNSDESVKTK